MIELKKKVELMQLLSKDISLGNILDIFIHEINEILNDDIFMFIYFTNKQKKLKAYRVFLYEKMRSLEDFYLNSAIDYKRFPTLNECITKNEIISIKKMDVEKYDDFVKQRFANWEVKQMIHFPISDSKTLPIGLFSLVSIKQVVDEEEINYIKDFISIIFNFIKHALNFEKILEIKGEANKNQKRLAKISKLSAKVNQLLEPDKIFKTFISEFLSIYGFNLGFIQIERDKSLPIVAYKASTEQAESIGKKLYERFSKVKYAPKIEGGEGPNAACSVTYLYNTHFYCKNFEQVKHLPMAEVDKEVLKIMKVNMKSFIQVPIYKKDSPYGILQLISFNKEVHLTDSDIELIKNVVLFIPSVLKNSELHSQVKKQNMQIRNELDIARKIYNKLIPIVPPSNLDKVKLSSIYKSMEKIGGDFFDYIRVLDPNILGIFISDVSGHGVPAALITSMLKTLIETAGSKRLNPSILLNYINKKIHGLNGDNFVTAFYSVYNMDTKILKYARAGHNYPFLIHKDGKIDVLEGRGKFLGVIEGIAFEEKEVLLKPGDKIIYYTDGVTEATNKKGEEFEDYLPEIFYQHFHLPIGIFVNNIYHELLKFREDYHFDDDVCLVGFELEE